MNSSLENRNSDAGTVRAADSEPQSSFHKLQKRAFGGEDVATRPGAEDDDWWPKGPLLTGIQEVINDFVERANDLEGMHLVFLLGGAGNGKSFAARALGKELGLQSEANDTLALRIYQATLNRTKIELLNDATIAPSSEYHSRQSVALASDIQRWWEASASDPVAAFCCVNRGIVIDELRSVAEGFENIDLLPRTILKWLASPELDVAGCVGATPLKMSPLALGSHYQEQQFEFHGRKVRISAVSVDACSLVEPEKGLSRAGNLFQQVVERCKEDAEARPENCPIKANVQHWRSPDASQSWENILSHAEIASGRLHSYRDIWGLAALTIIGPRFTNSDGAHSLLEHIDRTLDKARDATSDEDRLSAYLELSHFRLHNALFRSPTPTGRSASPFYPPSTPAHIGLLLVDPSAWGSPDSRTVEAAMQGIALGNFPSESLIGDGLLSNAWFAFDKELERAIVEFVSSDACPDVVRRRLVSWLGGYLTRLVGVSTGRLGNSTVIKKWKHCRDTSANEPVRLPLGLDEAVRSLVFPQHDHALRDSVVVPAFAARVEPLQMSQYGATPKLAEIIPHNSVNLLVRQQGSRLVLDFTLVGHPEQVGQLILDFPLLREALACGGARAGQTESTAHVEPRIERCRASSLAAIPENQRKLVVISGGKPMELS